MSESTISRRDVIKGLAAAGLSTAFPISRRAKASSVKSDRPNIIFVLTDDQRWDAMGCAGADWLKTPNMDRLAGEGVRFANAFVTTSLCSPSRASFLTGMYAHNHGVTVNGRVKPELPTTFLQILQSGGYETAFIGKWHIDGFQKPEIRGADRIVTFISQGMYGNNTLFINGKRTKQKGYVTDYLTDYAIDFIKQPRKKPFCMYLSHKAAHAPMTPADRHKGVYKNAPVELPEKFSMKEYRKENFMQMAAMKIKTPEDMRQRIIDYHETLLAVDESLGRILDLLDKTGQAENTMVVFAGDNGYFWGEHNLIDKREAYEESIRIPLLMRYPARIENPGRVVAEMVLNIDVCPTFLQTAEMGPPKGVQGESLTPILRNMCDDWRASWLYEYSKDPPWPTRPNLAVRTEDWKYITYPETPKVGDELYNLAADPEESNNLIVDPDSSNQLGWLKKEMERLKVETGYPGA